MHFYDYVLTLPKRQILDSSELEEFADDNFRLDENSRMFSERIQNTVRKGEIENLQQ